MSITVAQVETILMSRRGPALVACSITATPFTDASPRFYCADAIAFAARDQGATLADPTAVAPAELAAATDIDRLLDVAELRLLETLIAAFAQVTWSTATQKQDLNAYRIDLMKQYDVKMQYCKDRHGFGRGTIGAAQIDLGFGEPLCPWGSWG